MQAKVPVFIISFNRLECLRRLVRWLETAELAEPIIIDNGSTYGPLLDWFESMRATISIHRLDDNYGPYRVWEERLFENRTSPSQPFYVVTDPDVLPTEDCPRDAIPILIDTWRGVRCPKVGLSLRLEGIPDTLPTSQAVRGWERTLQGEVVRSGVAAERALPPYFSSLLDTTFQVNHRECVPVSWGSPGIRLAPPYQADHLGWQIDPLRLSEEDKFYWETASRRASTIETLRSAGIVGKIDGGKA
jgi:hypothetical protein